MGLRFLVSVGHRQTRMLTPEPPGSFVRFLALPPETPAVPHRLQQYDSWDVSLKSQGCNLTPPMSKRKRRRDRTQRIEQRPPNGASSGSMNPPRPSTGRQLRPGVDLAKVREETEEEVRRLADRARASMAPYDAFDVISHLLFRNIPLDPDAYGESTHEGLLAIVEFGGLLCLERPSRAGTGSREVFIGSVVEEWQETIHAVITNSLFHQIARIEEREAGSDWGSVRSAIANRELVVRNPRYEHQEKAALRAIFRTPAITSDLQAMVGFAVDEALAFENALTDLPTAVIREVVEEARAGESMMRDRVAQRRAESRSFTNRDMGGDDPVARLASMPSKKADRLIRNISIGSSWVRIGDRMQVTTGQLAEVAGTQEEAAQRFLDFFSVYFDQTPVTVAFGTHILRDRPIIHDGSGNYLCTSVANLLFSLRPRFTEALHSRALETGDGRVWERVNAERKRYSETAAVAALERALRPDVVLRNASFTLDGEDGELDGLVILDRTAIVVEAKAAGLTAPSRRGAPDRLRDELKDMVAKAGAQLARARRLLTSGTEVHLRTQDQGERILDTSRIRRVFLLAVTLEDLSFVAATIWDLIHSGLLPSDEEPPLVVSLHDLEIIAEVNEFPALLLHYFVRRQGINRMALVRAGDELDLYMHYLRQGLFYEHIHDEDEPPDVLFLTSQTDELDAYYLWKEGLRTTAAPMPRQKMHRELRRILDGLDDERPEGFSEASLMLLELAGDERDRVARTVVQQKRRSAKNARFHDLTVGLDGPPKRGMTFMTAPPSNQQELLQRLAVYCIAKKYQLRADAWVGLGFAVGSGKAFDAFVQSDEPCQKDEDLQRLADEMGLGRELPGSWKEASAFAQAQERERRRSAK
jgi:hypothetical protein